MKKTSIDQRRCPVCGHDNECGIATGKQHCWCFAQIEPPLGAGKLLAPIRGAICLCRPCLMSRHVLERALGNVGKVLQRR